MLKLLFINFIYIFTAANAYADELPRWALGFGMESRYQREVNPDYGDLRNLPLLYGKLRLWPIAVMLEAGSEQRLSNSGSLQVWSQSIGVTAWGRYEFFESGHWSPFVGVGLGAYFDRVDTAFAGARDTRTANRLRAGVGGGLTTTLWKIVLLEGEFRGEAVQRSAQADFALLVRIGVLF